MDKLVVMSTILMLASAYDELAMVQWEQDAIEAALRGRASSMGVKVGYYLHPIRVAAFGRKSGPPLFESLLVLGRRTVIGRILCAIDILAERL